MVQSLLCLAHVAREKEERRGEERGGILNITYAAGLRAELAVEKKLKKEKEVAHIAIYLVQVGGEGKNRMVEGVRRLSYVHCRGYLMLI